MDLLELPDKCLLVVAQLLGQQDKTSLRALARTNSRLHQLSVPVLSPAIASHVATRKMKQSLMRYLQKHGQLVSSLHLVGGSNEIVHDDHGSHGVCSHGAPHIKSALPDACAASLRALSISCLRVAAGSVLTSGLVQLTDLDLRDCIVTDGEKGLEAGLVAVGPSLRRLCMQRLIQPDGPWRFCALTFPNAALLSLTALTKLEFAGSIEVMANMPALVELRELSIWTAEDINMAAEDLPASSNLTSLVIWFTSGYYPSRGPAIATAALSRVPALQHLALSCDVCSLASDQGDTAALLFELDKLTQLTHLVLNEAVKAVAAAAAYSSLTASSNLHTLVMKDANLPDGAWQHVFGAGRQLPNLKSLLLRKARWRSNTWSGVGEQVFNAGAMTAGDVAGLAYSCPNLTSLVLQGVQQPGVPPQPLLEQLTGLRTLDVSGASDADVELLLQLPELRKLELPHSSLSDAAIQQLTQLTQLERLKVEVQREEEDDDDSSEEQEVARSDEKQEAKDEAKEQEQEQEQEQQQQQEDLEEEEEEEQQQQAGGGTRRMVSDVRWFTNKAPKGSPPDVWAQLAADCERRKDPVALKAWEEAKTKALMSGEWFTNMWKEGQAATPAGEAVSSSSSEEGSEDDED